MTITAPEDVLRSPNTVLANAVDSTLDVLRPRVFAEEPERIRFVVGTQINGHPHIGTHLVQSLAFLLAEQTRDDYGIDVDVEFHALDNAPAETVRDPETGHRYQRTYVHQLGPDAIGALVAEHYTPLFDALSARTNVPYGVTTYTAQQDGPEFRAEFVRTLEYLEEIRYWLDPSAGSAHIRLPCPVCGWAEKDAQRTRLLELDDSGALFESVCMDHGRYESDITPLGGGYVDLATLYRNVVKERAYRPDGTLRVMVKGGDWVYGCSLVDGAQSAIGPTATAPARIFTPQILGPDGGKLSKSLLRETAEAGPAEGAPFGWLLNPSLWPGTPEDYVRTLTGFGELLLSSPRHFFRSYTTTEMERLIVTTRKPATNQTQAKRPKSMAIYRQYFDLIADGSKTVEVRVQYPSMLRIKVGDLINFTCRELSCLTRVTRVGKYKTFKEMFGTEDVRAVNPNASEAEQLEAIYAIFPPEKEALGVITFQIERVKGDG
ncbi:ASCH domain-containing protein [Kitasatospora sp. NPDC098652]|uniref:ASCH domain-containing protein n=1 Tax=Kitasatospora sp. NPDC098652 TaxID=3364095 RepID=UPI003823B0C2